MAIPEALPILRGIIGEMSAPVQLDWKSLQDRNVAASLLDVADPALVAVAEIGAQLLERLVSPGWCWNCGPTPGHQEHCHVAALSDHLEALEAAVLSAGPDGASGR